MEKFYQERKRKHQKNMMRYLKYVFNDHFTLIAMILLGGCAMAYADFVKTVSTDFVIARPVLILFSFLIIFTGKLATLMKDADKVFLLPKEKEMKSYLNAAYRYSALLPIFLCVLGMGIMMPLLVAVSSFEFRDYFLFVLALIFLKLTHLNLQVEKMFLNSDDKYRKQMILFIFGAIIALGVSFYLQPLIGILVSLFLFVLTLRSSQNFYEKGQLDWEKMIVLENTRLRSIYQFINLFTDVPGLSGKVKRRKIFDGILSYSKKSQGNTFFYLYIRSFIRGTEYSGLSARLLLIGCVIQFMLPEFMYILIVSLILIYLIGFQLIPLYSQFDYMVMTQLYPISKQQKQQAMIRLVGILLSVVAVIFSVLSLIVLKNGLQFMEMLGCLFIEILLFIKIYLPARLKKINQR